LVDMGVDGILQCVVKKHGVMLWYGFIRLTTGEKKVSSCRLDIKSSGRVKYMEFD